MGFLGDAWNSVKGFFGGNQPSAPQYGSTYQVPHFNQQYGQYGRLAGQYGGRAAPMMGESSFRRQQAQHIDSLMADAAGRGPGQQLARMQAQGIADRVGAQQLGVAAGAAPGNSAMAARSAALAGGQAQSAVGEQAALAGVQARLGALGMAGQAISGARGQDLARMQANQSAQLQQTQLNDQAQLEALRQRLALSDLQQKGGLTYEQLLNQFKLGQMQEPTGFETMLGAGMGLGQAYLMSKR